jgi:two-component system, response regulator PdtaR
MGNRGVCISSANKPFLQKLSGLLQQHAIPVLGAATTHDMAIRLCHSLYPDALVTHQFLSGGSGFAAAEALLGHTPSIVLCPRGEADYNAPEGIQTMYLPVNASDLLKRIGEAEEAGRMLRVSSRERKLTWQRDVINRAKEKMMQREGLTEPQAHAALQRLSMGERITLYEAADRVLSQFEREQDGKEQKKE